MEAMGQHKLSISSSSHPESGRPMATVGRRTTRSSTQLKKQQKMSTSQSQHSKNDKNRLQTREKVIQLANLRSEIPTNEERPILEILDNDLFVRRACTGFRLFIRTFTDQQLMKCMKNSSLNTAKRMVQSNLRHVVVLRNAWKSLTEFDRIAWQHRYETMQENGNLPEELTEVPDEEPLEQLCTLKGDEQQRSHREHRQWISTLNSEKLPCPLCNVQDKYFDLNELMAHMTLSHPSLHLYACHICHQAFISKCSLEQHSAECKEYAEFLFENEKRTREQLTFDFAYASLICADCGLQFILSTRCQSDNLTETLLHLMLTHSNRKLVLCLIFASVELLKSPKIQIQFLRPFSLDMLMGRRENAEATSSVHLHNSNRADCSGECSECSKSFHDVNALRDHQMVEHMEEEERETLLTCLFLKQAVLLPAALDRSATAIHGPADCPKVKLVESDRAQSMLPSTEKQYIQAVKLKKKSRKFPSEAKKETITAQKESESGMDDGEQVQNGESELTFGEWNRQRMELERKANSPNSQMAAFLSTLSLDISHSDSELIARNPLDGALLNDSVFQCSNCWAIFIGVEAKWSHILGKCSTNEAEFHQLFDDAEHSFPFERIRCAICPDADFCSIFALRIHMNLAHGILCAIGRNKTTIEQCAMELLTGNWLNTDFDRQLHTLINNPNKRIKCKRGLESSALAQEYLSSEPTASLVGFKECKNEPIDHTYEEEEEGRNSSARMLPEKSPNMGENAILKREPDALDESPHIGTSSQFLADHGFESADDRSSMEVQIGGGEQQPVEEQPKESGKRYNFLPISKDGGQQQKGGRTPYSHRLVPTPAYQAPTKSHYVCFMCTFPERPYTDAFDLHLMAHPDTEHWHTCPICEEKNRKVRRPIILPHFDHPLQFFKHVEKRHMRIRKNLVGCPYCDHSIATDSLEPDPKAVAAVFRHMVYECTKTELCLLCGHSTATDPLEQQQDREQQNSKVTTVENPLFIHRWIKHRLIFDRFICSSCKNGFYSREEFIKHECELALRCSCNPYYRFRTRAEYAIHLQRNIQEWKVHHLMETRLEKDISKRRYLLNEEYSKTVLARIKQVEEERKDASKNTRGSGIAVDKWCLPKGEERHQPNIRRTIVIGGTANDGPTQRTPQQLMGRFSGGEPEICEATPAKRLRLDGEAPRSSDGIMEKHGMNHQSAGNTNKTKPFRIVNIEKDVKMEGESGNDTPPPKLMPEVGLSDEDDEEESDESEDADEREEAVDRVIDSLVTRVVELVDGRPGQYAIPFWGTKKELERKQKGVLRCDQCFLIFCSRDAMEQHRTMAHGRIKYFPIPTGFNLRLCRICCIAFFASPDSSLYFDHMNEHHLPNPRPAACHYCSAVSSDREYGLHKLHHPKDFICSICLLRFTNEIKLAQHLMKMHKKVFAYFCKICGFCNTRLTSVLEHMFIRSRNGQCSVINQQFVVYYVGVCDAAQLRFQPDHPKWLEQQMAVGKIARLIEQSDCRHHCLRNCNEPAIISCNDCLCPIPFSTWNDNFYQSDNQFRYKEQCKLIEEGRGADSVANTLYQIFSAESAPPHFRGGLTLNMNTIHERLRQEIIGGINREREMNRAREIVALKKSTLTAVTFGRVQQSDERNKMGATYLATMARHNDTDQGGITKSRPILSIMPPRASALQQPSKQQQYSSPQSTPVRFVPQRPPPAGSQNGQQIGGNSAAADGTKSAAVAAPTIRPSTSSKANTSQNANDSTTTGHLTSPIKEECAPKKPPPVNWTISSKSTLPPPQCSSPPKLMAATSNKLKVALPVQPKSSAAGFSEAFQSRIIRQSIIRPRHPAPSMQQNSFWERPRPFYRPYGLTPPPGVAASRPIVNVYRRAIIPTRPAIMPKPEQTSSSKPPTVVSRPTRL